MSLDYSYLQNITIVNFTEEIVNDKEEKTTNNDDCINP